MTTHWGSLLRMDGDSAPYLRFIEPPTNEFPFRNESEISGIRGSLSGENSFKATQQTQEQTYPTVELMNFSGNAEIRCSIYQINNVENCFVHEFYMGEEFKPHSHKLLMKNGENEMEDPHHLPVGPKEGFVAKFHSMEIVSTPGNIVSEVARKMAQLEKERFAFFRGIQRDLPAQQMEEIRRSAELQSKSMIINIVCLRFDAFIFKHGIRRPICTPLFSNGINNLKCAPSGDLKIVHMDHCSSKAEGGQKISILIELVRSNEDKKYIRIRFFKLDENNREVWEDYGQFSESDFHQESLYQYTLVFSTPAFREQDITDPVIVYMELERITDPARSEKREFRYTPNNKKTSKKTVIVQVTASADVHPQDTYTLQNDISDPDHQPSLTDHQNTPLNRSNPDEVKILLGPYENDLPDEMITFEAGVKNSALPNQFNSPKRLTNVNAVAKIEVSPEDIAEAQKFYDELLRFVKTDEFRTCPPLLEQPNNALHVFIALNKRHEVVFILNILLIFKRLQLANAVNADTLTPLHIAVMCRNEEAVGYLRRFNADPTIQNSEGRTPLHEAVKSSSTLKMFELLLSKNPMIDIEDYDGSTALRLAIETANMTAVKVLCSEGADVNKPSGKDGHTPLRVAVEHEFAEAVKYFLAHPRFSQADFQNVSALQAAVLKPSSCEIREYIINFAEANNINLELRKGIGDIEEMPQVPMKKASPKIYCE